MKLTWSLGLLLLVALLFGAYLNRSCFGPKDAHEIALDSLALRLKEADSAAAIYQQIASEAMGEASRSAQDADSLRKAAGRVAGIATRLRARLDRSSTPVEPRSDTVPRTLEEPSPIEIAFDSLAQAYDLMVRVDSLNQVTIGALTRRIAADSSYIETLEKVREAGRQVVRSRPSLLSKILPRPMVGYGVMPSDGSVYHGPILALGWRL